MIHSHAAIAEHSGSLQRGQLGPKFQVKGVAPINNSSSQITRLNDISYGIKIWTDLSSVLSQSTHLSDGQTEGQTDRQTAFSWLHRDACGKNVLRQQEIG